MKPSIDFMECLKDSPRFRGSLEEAENDIDTLEAKLERLVKLCNGMIEAGKVFNNANGAFIHGVRDVAVHFKDDEMVSDDALVGDALEKFTHNMTELQKYHNILLDQAHRSISKNLNNFIKNDIKKLKDTRKHFEKISDDMDNALNKNASAPRSKAQECEDAHNVLTAMKSCFAHTSLDYVFQINILHSKKRFDILDTMLAYMHAQNAYFHQGSDLFADLEPYMKTIATQLEQLSGRAAAERKEMEERHTLVQGKDGTVGEEGAESQDNQIKVEGYLFKRTSNAFKSWVRRWFMIQNNQLVYRKRSKDSLTIMEDDLRLCTVKPAFEIDRRFCFEVVSPSRSHMLQADSEQECQLWITAIQAGVSNAYRDSPHKDELDQKDSPMSPEARANGGSVAPATARQSAVETGMQAKISRMEQILSIPGNEFCCDCGSPDPRWASINLGITLCIECSGIHRGFGVHMSKVRSVTLDAWEPELVKVMLELGNNVINRVYEANIDETVAKHASPQCNRSQREAWIRAKYIQKAFVRRLPLSDDGAPPTVTVTGSGAGTTPPASDNTRITPSPGDNTRKRWSVQKRRRRSPGKQAAVVAPSAASGETKLAQGESQDSGLGGSTNDVIVFGASVNSQNGAARGLDLDSEGSSSETEADPDSQSTTSFEELSKLHPDLLLFKAAQARNLPVMLEALAQGANPNWSNSDDEGKTPLIKATESGSMAPCELLLLNGAKVDRKDEKGRSALHHATVLGHTGQVCQFLKRNANQNAMDVEGHDPLSIAVKNANADIVTLLRLAKLNEEMKETEGFLGGPDETFTEVFRDFTNMASNTPERLSTNNK